MIILCFVFNRFFVMGMFMILYFRNVIFIVFVDVFVMCGDVWFVMMCD